MSIILVFLLYSKRIEFEYYVSQLNSNDSSLVTEYQDRIIEMDSTFLPYLKSKLSNENKEFSKKLISCIEEITDFTFYTENTDSLINFWKYHKELEVDSLVFKATIVNNDSVPRYYMYGPVWVLGNNKYLDYTCLDTILFLNNQFIFSKNGLSKMSDFDVWYEMGTHIFRNKYTFISNASFFEVKPKDTVEYHFILSEYNLKRRYKVNHDIINNNYNTFFRFVYLYDITNYNFKYFSGYKKLVYDWDYHKSNLEFEQLNLSYFEENSIFDREKAENLNLKFELLEMECLNCDEYKIEY